MPTPDFAQLHSQIDTTVHTNGPSGKTTAAGLNALLHRFVTDLPAAASLTVDQLAALDGTANLSATNPVASKADIFFEAGTGKQTVMSIALMAQPQYDAAGNLTGNVYVAPNTNSISGENSSILGAQDSEIAADNSIIIGGQAHTIGNNYGLNSIIGGSASTIADGAGSFNVMVGGNVNKLLAGYYCAMIGGSFNTARDSSVIIGNNNTAFGYKGTVIAGNANTMYGYANLIIDGSDNRINESLCSVLGGSYNSLNGLRTSVVNGSNNTLDGSTCSVVNSDYVTIPATCSHVSCYSCNNFTVPENTTNKVYINNQEYDLSNGITIAQDLTSTSATAVPSVAAVTNALVAQVFTPGEIKALVTAGTYLSGELQDASPNGSLPGMKFVDASYRYEYQLGMNDLDGSGYLWIRSVKG